MNGLTGVATGAGAGVVVERPQNAATVVQARRGVAGVVDLDFAKTGAESNWTVANESGGAAVQALANPARAPVLASRPRQARISVLTKLSHVL